MSKEGEEEAKGCCHHCEEQNAETSQNIKEETHCCHHCEKQEVGEKHDGATWHHCENTKEETHCCHHEGEEKHEECGGCCSASNGSEGSCACCDLAANYEQPKKDKKKKLIAKITIISVAIPLLILGFMPWDIEGKFKFLPFYYFNPAWIVIAMCGWQTYYYAFKSLFKGKITTPLLISLAMTGCIVLEILHFTGTFKTSLTLSQHSHSNIFAAGEIAFLMFLGEFIEEITIKKCRSGIERLVGLIPTKANVITENGVKSVPLSEIKVGDIVLIKLGEQISVDGVVIEGHGSVDQSSLTGEYIPVEVGVGDNVYGGTFNKEGVFKVRVEKKKEDMIIAKMANLAIEAEGKKAPIARVADKWSKVIVPVVLLLSVIVGLVSKYAGIIKSDNVNGAAISNAITVLVVFCPCALVLATPTAIAAGLGHAAKHGVLLKSGAMLEEMSRIKNVCFDKTGTLTKGEVKLEKFVAIDQKKKDEYLAIAKGIEAHSEHPLAKAVTSFDDNIKAIQIKTEDIKVTPGVGISANMDKHEYSILGISKCQAEIPESLQSIFSTAEQEGKTITVLLKNNTVIAGMVFSDTLRDNAEEVVSTLNTLGYRTHMLTGDNANSANNIASQVGISEVHAQLLPEDKLNKIYEIQKTGKTAMIGDGINDAPSLKAADCSFAVANIGNDTAIESADMTIMEGDISKVSYMLKYSKKVIGIIKTNIAVAMTINLGAVILAMFGKLDPIIGALIHNLTSVMVVSISASLLRKKKPTELKKSLK